MHLLPIPPDCNIQIFSLESLGSVSVRSFEKCMKKMKMKTFETQEFFFFEISRKFSFGSTNTVMTGISVLVNHIFHISTFTYVSMRHRTKLALVFFTDAAFNLSILLCTISPIISVFNDLPNSVSEFSGICPSD